MGRVKDNEPKHKRSYTISLDLYEWIERERKRNGYADVNAQVAFMLSKARRMIERERIIEETYPEKNLLDDPSGEGKPEKSNKDDPKRGRQEQKNA